MRALLGIVLGLLLLGFASAATPINCVVAWAKSSYGSECITPCTFERDGYQCRVLTWTFAGWIGSLFGGSGAMEERIEPCATAEIDPAVILNSNSSWTQCVKESCVSRTTGGAKCREDPTFGLGFTFSLHFVRSVWTCSLESGGLLPGSGSAMSSEKPCAMNSTHAVYTSTSTNCLAFIGADGSCDLVNA